MTQNNNCNLVLKSGGRKLGGKGGESNSCWQKLKKREFGCPGLRGRKNGLAFFQSSFCLADVHLMSDECSDACVFKTPDGPVPKKRKLVEDEDAGVPFNLPVSEPTESSTSPTSKDIECRNNGSLHRSTTPPLPSEQRYGADVPLEGNTPPLTPNSSPRHSCPSSPCESHHSSQHVHHAKLQVLRASSSNLSSSPAPRRRIGIVQFSPQLLPVIDALPKVPGKCAAIQSILEAFNLFDKMETIVPAMASAKDLMAFHSEEFVEVLRKCASPTERGRGFLESSSNSDLSSSGDRKNGREKWVDPSSSDTESIELEEDMEIYGLKDECPPFPGLWHYVRLTAGATILAARYLIECDRETVLRSPEPSPRSMSAPIKSVHSVVSPSSPDSHSNGTHLSSPISMSASASPLPRLSTSPNGHSSQAPVAIHWMGGRHHAKREEATGLCYVNDAVLGLLQLVNHFERVMYIDIDIHHGDGTEEAFKFSKQVLTISCHLHDPGFFPGSGSIDEVGEGKAQYFTINVPFREGVTDAQYTKIFDSLIQEATQAYKPLAIVFVAGADCLSGDPLGGFNLTLHAVEHCTKTLLALNLPLLILGGGGYSLPNVARLSAIVTAACLDIQLPDKIPMHSNLFVDTATYYTPSHNPKPNRNTEEYTKLLEATVMSNLQHIRPSE